MRLSVARIWRNVGWEHTTPQPRTERPFYAGIATVAHSDAQPPPHSLDRDEQQRGAENRLPERAEDIDQEFKDEFDRVPHGVANPAIAWKCPMTDAAFCRLVLARSVTTAQAARLFGRDQHTIARWAREAGIGFKPGGGPHAISLPLLELWAFGHKRALRVAALPRKPDNQPKCRQKLASATSCAEFTGLSS
jgi:hypothetical protein